MFEKGSQKKAKPPTSRRTFTIRDTMVPAIRDDCIISRRQQHIHTVINGTRTNGYGSVREPRVTTLISGFAPSDRQGIQIESSSIKSLRFSIDPATGAQTDGRPTSTTVEHKSARKGPTAAMVKKSLAQKRFPDLPKSIIDKFDEHYGKDDEKTIEALQSYVQFRKMYNLDDSARNANTHQTDNDAADWAWASQVAVHAAKNIKGKLLPGVEGCGTIAERVCNLTSLPQMMFSPQYEDGSYMLTKAGNPVFHLIPAMIDLAAVSPDVYTLCCTLYVERKSKHVDFDPFGAALMADTRPGVGWPNLTIFQIMGFLSLWVKTLQKYKPGCMTKLFIFNITYVAVGIFNVSKSILPKSIADNTRLVGGGNKLKDAVSKDLSKFVPEDGVEIMEKTRLSMFRYDK